MTQRIAVIGAGHLGKIHARLLGQVEGAVLVGIVDPTESARAAAAAQFSVPVVSCHSELLDHIDAAVVASPTGMHAQIATDLLNAGKHVFVEKPLATSAEDAYALARLADAKGCTLQVGHVERFNPAWVAAGDMLGKPKYIEAVRASRFPGRCLDVGVVMDLMIHDLDLVLSLTDAPICDIQASGLALITEHEDLVEARLCFECGLVAHFKASRVSPTPARQMQAFTENGFVDIDFGRPSLTLVRPDAQLLNRQFELSQATANPLGFADELFDTWLDVATPEILPRNAILDELHDFVISIGSRSAPAVSGYAGARAVEVATAILDAVDARRWSASNDWSQRGPFATPGKHGVLATARVADQQTEERRIAERRRAA